MCPIVRAYTLTIKFFLSPPYGWPRIWKIKCKTNLLDFCRISRKIKFFCSDEQSKYHSESISCAEGAEKIGIFGWDFGLKFAYFLRRRRRFFWIHRVSPKIHIAFWGRLEHSILSKILSPPQADFPRKRSFPSCFWTQIDRRKTSKWCKNAQCAPQGRKFGLRRPKTLKILEFGTPAGGRNFFESAPPPCFLHFCNKGGTLPRNTPDCAWKLKKTDFRVFSRFTLF